MKKWGNLLGGGGKKKGKKSQGAVFWGASTFEDPNVFEPALSFVKACINWLKSHKSHEKEGIFRKAGAEKRLGELMLEIGKMNPIQFADEEDEHTIATLLKRFFRDMAQPLLTFDLYTTFIAADSYEGDERFINLKNAVKLLPPRNRTLLELVCKYLKEVAAYSEMNFMTPNNLAIVFAPNFLRPLVETQVILISDAGHATALVASLIVDCEKIFVSTPRAVQPDFYKTMTVRYKAHQLKSEDAFSAAARAHNDQEQFRRKLNNITLRIKGGDTKALEFYFDDNASPASGGMVSSSSSSAIPSVPSGREGVSERSSSMSAANNRRQTEEDFKAAAGFKRTTRARPALSLDLFDHGKDSGKSTGASGAAPTSAPPSGLSQSESDDGMATSARTLELADVLQVMVQDASITAEPTKDEVDLALEVESSEETDGSDITNELLQDENLYNLFNDYLKKTKHDEELLAWRLIKDFEKCSNVLDDHAAMLAKAIFARLQLVQMQEEDRPIESPLGPQTFVDVEVILKRRLVPLLQSFFVTRDADDVASPRHSNSVIDRLLNKE